MLATAIRIDRLIEGDVGRLVARDDGAGGIVDHFGMDRGSGIVIGAPAIVPSVIQQGPAMPFVSAHRIGKGASTLQEITPYRGV